ncbi:Abhydrolase-3 domain-containing protein [Fusarium keratoplasticum]|uniref:Abhydrolase-3 domain-containing protein n=1 Tax=Fusarium keratoplasticum TaxID=1328300 RepID=A0ACC0RA53_9HYPO|nr:Abhydrolase-3 domain-containing protein [Fusarium keratoplasticum]KAI8675836.1 Abhydrolase-3 domain-containing protein [Fusarium keratoplasticum]
MSLESLAQMTRLYPVQSPTSSRTEYTKNLIMRDGHVHEVGVYKPQSLAPGPLVVLIHGGGFCLGHYSHISFYSRALAALYGVTVVNIAYRLAPEFPFPTAPQDVWDSLVALTSSNMADELGLDLSKGFFIGGTSAGASLAAVAVQQWVSQELSPPILGVWLNIPMIFDAAIVPGEHKALWFSRKQNADAMVINSKSREYVYKVYKPDIRSPEFSPFNSPNPHTGLPPVYIQVCGQDPLRDDGLVYERVLREHGVKTRLDAYPGVPHGAANLFPTLSSSKKHQVDVLQGFGWLFGKEMRDEECQAAMKASWED